MLTLSVSARTKDVSAEDLRLKGLVPAVFYGPKEQSTGIVVDAKKLESIFKEAGETTIVRLAGIGEEKDTLIHDIQFHPVSGMVIHADFYVIEKGKKVTINVPLEFTGVAPAEKLGHIVVKALHEVEIEVAPAELPHHLLVDISKMENVGDRILAKDIALPPSAELLTDADEIVIAVTEFKEEKEEIEPVVPATTPADEKAKAAEAAAPTGAGDKGDKKTA